MSNPILEVTEIAAGAITENACVVFDANGKVTLPGGANAVKFAGVAGHAAAISAQVRVAKLGIVLVVAAAAIAAGERLMIAGNTGKVTPVLAVAGTVYNAVGTAQEAATADGDIINMLIDSATLNTAVS